MLSVEEYAAKRGIGQEATDEARGRLEARARAYKLREARSSMGATHADLARELGVSQKRISEIERGDVGSLRLSTLGRYARGLGGTLRVSIELPGGRTSP